jgi:hypothetical protein
MKDQGINLLFNFKIHKNHLIMKKKTHRFLKIKFKA